VGNLYGQCLASCACDLGELYSPRLAGQTLFSPLGKQQLDEGRLTRRKRFVGLSCLPHFSAVLSTNNDDNDFVTLKEMIGARYAIGKLPLKHFSLKVELVIVLPLGRKNYDGSFAIFVRALDGKQFLIQAECSLGA